MVEIGYDGDKLNVYKLFGSRLSPGESTCNINVCQLSRNTINREAKNYNEGTYLQTPMFTCNI